MTYPCTLFFSLFHTPELGCRLKLTTLAMDSMFFFADHLLHLQAVFRVAGRCHFGRRVVLHKLVVARDNLNQYIYEPHRKYHQQSGRKFLCVLTYDIWSLGCIIYHRLFGSPLCNFDRQQINSLILFLYTIASISLQCSCFYFKLS